MNLNIIAGWHSLWERMSGPPDEFPLTVRIFHSVLLICIIALVYNIPLNLVVGLPAIAAACVVAMLLVTLLYYASRYRNRTATARLIFCLVGNLLFVINFFLNSGIDGPTGYFFILMIVVIVAVVPVSEYPYWIGGNLLACLGLNFLQYQHPAWVPFTYPHQADRYLDMSSAYATVVVIVLCCFYIIRRQYDTERREAQKVTDRLQELNAERNKLFSIIAHDLRSPLGHIQSYLELLSGEDIPAVERQQIKLQLLESTRGTIEMLNNVLHWSRSQLSGAEIGKTHLPVGEVLLPLVSLFGDIAARKQIRLESTLPDNVTVYGDKAIVQLIVRNLLNNAIKFTAPGGEVRLQVESLDQICRITITDSGNGQPATLTEDIFTLQAVSKTGTANETGVGLGLALCREYTALLNGRLWFISDPQSGATFFLELPA